MAATRRPLARTLLSLAAILPPLLVAGAPARAQLAPGGEHLLRIGFAGGVVVPTSDARNALKNGIQGQGFLLVNLLPGFPLRFNLGYQKFDLKSALAASGLPTGTTSSGTTNILSGVAGAQINLLSGPLRPYITAGVGGFNVSQSLNSAASTGSASTSQFKFGVDGGAGIALNIGRIAAFVEGRVQNIYTDQGAINLKSIQAVPVSFGIIF